jgi:hypothetical protein
MTPTPAAFITAALKAAVADIESDITFFFCVQRRACQLSFGE